MMTYRDRGYRDREGNIILFVVMRMCKRTASASCEKSRSEPGCVCVQKIRSFSETSPAGTAPRPSDSPLLAFIVMNMISSRQTSFVLPARARRNFAASAQIVRVLENGVIGLRKGGRRGPNKSHDVGGATSEEMGTADPSSSVSGVREQQSKKIDPFLAKLVARGGFLQVAERAKANLNPRQKELLLRRIKQHLGFRYSDATRQQEYESASSSEHSSAAEVGGFDG